MLSFIQDLKYALRMLGKSPGFTAAAIATLALGIGANTAIFTVADRVLMRPLPYDEPSRLAMVFMARSKTRDRIPLSLADFLDWRAQTRAFEEPAAFSEDRVNLTGRGRPEQVWGVRATAGLFSTLRAKPEVGRLFRPGEDRPGSEAAVVLSHGLWQSRFGSDRSLIGRTILLDGQSHTVIGVLPPDFRFPSPEVGLWTTLPVSPPSRRAPYFLSGIARLRPGSTVAGARAELDALARRLGEEYPRSNRGAGFNVVPLREVIVGEVRPALIALLAAVAFLLLIACVNVTNLLLARSAAREREFAIRTALGAGRGRMLRQSLVENLLLGLLGGLAGLLLAYWGLDLLRSLGPSNIPRLREIDIDGRALAFTFLISSLSGVLFGLAPAWRKEPFTLADSLREGKSTGGFVRGRLGRALVAAEVSLAILLLIAAGLTIKSFVALQSVEIGIDPKDTVALQISLSAVAYADDHKVRSFSQELLRGVEALPGVRSAGLGSSLPPDRLEISDIFTVEGSERDEPRAPKVHAPLVPVSPGYFRTLGVSLRQGRFFTDSDDAGAPRVVIVNETLAQRYFPGGNAVGRRMRVGGEERPDNPWLTVVGVVGDVKYNGLAGPPWPAFYQPLLQSPTRSMYLVVRSRSDAEALMPSLRRVVWTLDPDLPVAGERTLTQLVLDSVAQPRLRTLLLAVFGAAGLLLASLGIYGVLSYSVSQRTREIGVRMALGASRSDVVTLVVGQGMRLALLGAGAGLAIALGLARLMSALLFGVQPRDLLVFATVPLILAGVAFLACLLPARRAARIDPMTALRSE